MYKVITKVLAGRMTEVLTEVISQYQNAFVKGRRILDCSFIASEVLNSKIKGGGGMIFRVDMMKVYDHASCNFLDFIWW